MVLLTVVVLVVSWRRDIDCVVKVYVIDGPKGVIPVSGSRDSDRAVDKVQFGHRMLPEGDDGDHVVNVPADGRLLLLLLGDCRVPDRLVLGKLLNGGEESPVCVVEMLPREMALSVVGGNGWVVDMLEKILVLPADGGTPDRVFDRPVDVPPRTKGGTTDVVVDKLVGVLPLAEAV